MKLYRDPWELMGIKNPVVTTGSFDGVHVGHKAIIRRLKDIARKIGGETVLITFDPHPRRVLYPETAGKDLLMILSQKEKIELLEKTGLDHMIIIPFTKKFSEISSSEFIEKYLVEMLHTRTVVVGFNHQFGFRREGDFSHLYKLGRKFGFNVEEIPEQDIQNESVSSTKIRKALMDGNIQRANAYLDHYYLVKGIAYLTELSETGVDREVFRLEPDERVKLIPPDGVYAVSIVCGSWHNKGLVNIYNREIINSSLSESTKIDFLPIVTGYQFDSREATLYFHKKLRDRDVLTDQSIKVKQLEKDLIEVSELIF
jgi:riboflavin kinase/FMN adenylyltransferase